MKKYTPFRLFLMGLNLSVVILAILQLTGVWDGGIDYALILFGIYGILNAKDQKNPVAKWISLITGIAMLAIFVLGKYLPA